MKSLNMLLAAGAVTLAGGAANAATYYATTVESVSPGLCDTAYQDPIQRQCSKEPSRYVPSNALGERDGNFYSLGLTTDEQEGSITLGFGDTFTGGHNAGVWEVTYNISPSNPHREAVDVYSILGGVSTFLGRLTNLAGGGMLRTGGAFEYIKLVDATLDEFGRDGTTSFDGFDVDSVSVAPVPLPAAGLMLLAGLGGFAAMRRRKNAAAA